MPARFSPPKAQRDGLRLPDGTLLAAATASAVLRPFRNISME